MLYIGVVTLPLDCLEEFFSEQEMTNKKWHIRNAVENFFIACLCHRDVEETIAPVCEDVLSVGTGTHETVRNREEFRTLVLEDVASSPVSTEFHFEDYTETSLSDTVVAAIFQMLLTILETANRVDRQRKAATIHVSTPALKQEDCEYFSLRNVNNQVHLAQEPQKQLRALLLTSLPGGIFGFTTKRTPPSMSSTTKCSAALATPQMNFFYRLGRI